MITSPYAGPRPWIVWGVGMFSYVVAVLDRTTFGVSGVQATERFGVSASVLSTFVLVQVIVYSGAQVPAGVLLDRFGSRLMIVTGGTLMACGQVLLAVTTELGHALTARVLVGLGDAFMFIAVISLVPRWFAPRRIPIVTQLTGIGGQLGQVLSAVPFLAILEARGWATAYLSAAAVGLVAVALAAAFIRNQPPGVSCGTVGPIAHQKRALIGPIRAVWRSAGTRLAFFTHMGTQFSMNTFSLMWGLPYLILGQGLSSQLAGALMSFSVVVMVVSAPLVGAVTSRYPNRRVQMALGYVAGLIATWAGVLVLPTAAPLWVLVILMTVIGLGGPASIIALDIVRTSTQPANLGTAQAITNLGGYLGSLALLQGMGMAINAAGGYSFDSFRIAWSMQAVLWIVALVGIALSARAFRAETRAL
ncbi:MFS transporter [Gordonia jinghuaiqii]|uniref:MFS transporter n=1 Tax=Gordonia jinghuaiqii TaxID=2758710 RepID=A0A7D7R2E5_9ACTN|nr:MFS transporter [Gordonia jinghuaiqii]MCR5978003.1 MFS transporter [Gordonia jinghuaiqii]QMT01527.1 MFS transporter [Gordonia jinghuaiqii]